MRLHVTVTKITPTGEIIMIADLPQIGEVGNMLFVASPAIEHLRRKGYKEGDGVTILVHPFKVNSYNRQPVPITKFLS